MLLCSFQSGSYAPKHLNHFQNFLVSKVMLRNCLLRAHYDAGAAPLAGGRHNVSLLDGLISRMVLRAQVYLDILQLNCTKRTHIYTGRASNAARLVHFGINALGLHVSFREEADRPPGGAGGSHLSKECRFRILGTSS